MANARRGKKDSADAGAATPTSKNGTTAAKTKTSNQLLQEQLDRAAASLAQNAEQMALLHGQWRTYLTGLSYLVVLLSFHQFQSTSSACLFDIKAVNKQAVLEEDFRIPGMHATALVLKDAAAIILGIIMAAAICLWLRVKEGGDDFSHPFYMTAQSCVLPILGIVYFHTFNKQTASCLEASGLTESGSGDVIRRILDGIELPSTTNPTKSGWPVVLVFHVIVTLSVWFMKKQQTELRKNEMAVQELRDELKQATEAKKKK